jgi:hypothetical protein
MMSDAKSMMVVTIDPELEDLIPRFLENTRKDLADLSLALAKSDLDTVRRIGHSMKSYGLGFGFELISLKGKAIETAAVQPDPPAVHVLLKELEDYLDNVKVICGQ